MKSINLLSLLSAYKDLNDIPFRKYIGEFGMGPLVRANELKDLHTLVDEISAITGLTDLFNHFYMGFKIQQISKEFDLLRIGENSVINIELKRQSTIEKITKQLIQNEYYLKFLDVPIYNFTFVASTKKLYMLVDSKTIKEVKLDFLISKLREQQVKEIDNLHDLFDPIHYLISLYEVPEAFLNDEYFLTTQQSTFKKEILSYQPTEHSIFIMIEGGAGTGKTLLTYDLAKEYRRNGENVLIFHCGKFNKGHKKLRDKYNWTIKPIRHFNEKTDDISSYDVVIFVEAQRLEKAQLLKFIELTKRVKIKCIFSLNRHHCFMPSHHNIAEFIEEHLKPKKYELKTVIRYNKEMHAFINHLFDLSKRSPMQKYSNISIQYFSAYDEAKSYLSYLEEKGWKVVDYSSPKLADYPCTISEDVSDILGEEYDHVVATLDEGFYYKSNQKLATSYPHYDVTKLLYQNMIRVRKKLHLVVINNPTVLEMILSILHNEEK
ncbi:DNA/RNA helicase domain-containing protein [Lysinibacillus sp. LZ02]|uniref:DNA/RNA helicase domain-containing protein n=1 Tax=Lysinibacillus sp. LZ02 TaxID=3420668 RepID=UPI003D35E699